ncbi:MFS transporter [Deinococcus pimensis]|uniref:MFS transporter n=1 Tax=Deinococcus pimensis TaxID=309888 RepID=UPI0004B91678|nr:MFS transporter [Deinococcus pimensis]
MSRPPPNPLPALLVLALAYFTLGTAALAVIGLSLPIGHTFDVTPARTGLLVTVFALTFAAAALLTQSLAGHWPRRRLLLTGLTLLTLGLIAGALAPTFAALLLTRVLVAVGAAMIGPAASATASQLAPPERQAQALALVFTGFTFSSVLGVPLAALLGPALGWRGTLLALAGVAVLTALLVRRLVPHLPGGARVTPAVYGQALTTPGVRPALLATLLQIAAPFAVYGVAASYLTQRFGSTPAWISTTLLAFGVAGVIGNTLAGLVTARRGFTRTLNLSLIGATVVFVGLFALPGLPWPGVIAFAAMSLFTQMFQTPQQARLIHLGPQVRALMLALNASVVYLGISVGSALGSTLLPHLGARPLALIPLALILVALIASHHATSASSAGTPPSGTHPHPIPAERADVSQPATAPVTPRDPRAWSAPARRG